MLGWKRLSLQSARRFSELESGMVTGSHITACTAGGGPTPPLLCDPGWVV